MHLEADAKVRFFRFFEQGNLDNTVVYLQEDASVVYHNIITNKKTKFKLKIEGISQIDFDPQNDTLLVLDGLKEHIQMFDIYQKTQIVLKKTNITTLAGFHVLGFKHIKSEMVAVHGV